MAQQKSKPKQQTAGFKKQRLDASATAGNTYLWLLLIVLLTFVAYFPSLRNSFVNWDDQAYILENPLIRTFNLKEIFSSYQLANYHPITMLIYTIEYHLFGLNATGYHAVNLLIHLLNTVLVYYFVLGLTPSPSPKERGAWQVAAVTALLFGVHPIHVESVAWTSELKDLLYTCFFLGSTITYLKYLKLKQRKYFNYSLLLFFLSLLSKAMGASLPIVLLLIDYFKGRKLDSKAWLEKAPFFVLAIIFGIVAVFAQQSLKAIDINIYPFPQRIVFACYGFITYLLKLVLPLNLSAYYPYPIKRGENIPAAYYGYVVLLLALVVAVWRMASLKVEKNNPRLQSRAVLFGVAFFTITIFLVLQLLPVGGAVMADRYAYIPSIGIFYLAAVCLTPAPSPSERGGRKPLAILLLAVFTIFFSVKTFAQCGVWKDGLTLWNDVIRQYQTITIAYYNRGNLYLNDKKNDEALNDFTKAIENDPGYARAYSNRANVLQDEGKLDAALQDFTKSIELESDNYRTYNNRGNVEKQLKKYDDALRDLNKAIELKPDFYEAYNNRGLLYMDWKKYAEGKRDFDKAIEMHPDQVDGYNNRGLLEMDAKEFDNAVRDFDKTLELKPDFIDGYNNRGYLYSKMNKPEEALRDYNKVIEMNPSYPRGYYNRANLLVAQNKFDEALRDYSKTVELQPGNGEAWYNKAIIEFNTGKKEQACSDLQAAAKTGYELAANAFRDLCGGVIP